MVQEINYVSECVIFKRSIGANKEKIVCLNKDLAQHAKNPNFYRNQRIIAVAATIAIVAAVALTSYLTFGLGVAVICSPVGGYLFVPALFLMTAPLFGLTFLKDTVPNIFRNAQKDRETIAELTAKNKSLELEQDSMIATLNSQVDRYSAAIAEGFSPERIWAARQGILEAQKHMLMRTLAEAMAAANSAS